MPTSPINPLDPYADEDQQDYLRRALMGQPMVAGLGATPNAAVNLPAIKGPDMSDLHDQPLESPPYMGRQAIAGPTRMTEDQAEQERLRATGSGVSQLQARHPVLGGFARAADVLGGIIAPNIAPRIPGTTAHHDLLMRQNQANINQDVAQQEREAQTGETEARAEEERARIPGILNPQPKPDPEEQAYQSLSTQTNPDTGKPYTPYEAYQKVKQAGQVEKPPASEFALWQQQNPNGTLADFEKAKAEANPKPGDDFEKYYRDWLADNHAPDTAHNRLVARERFAAAGQAPQRPQQQLGVDPTGKIIELKPGMTVAGGTKSLTGDLAGSKPTADETKRADMAENMNENLDKLEEIVTRRPELFGKLAGRITQGKMFIGSDDPDIGSLNTIKDQLGMVQQSAHNMRSAQHVEAAARSILNDFKNGPDAIKGSIKTARDSVATFTKDVQQGNPSVRTTPQGGAAPSGMAVSLSQARQLPRNAGKSDDEIRKDIKAHGHTVLEDAK